MAGRPIQLPILIERPPSAGPRAITWFFLINGGVISLLFAIGGFHRGAIIPIVASTVWAMVLLAWWAVLQTCRGRLTLIDGSQIRMAKLKLRDPTRTSVVTVKPVSSYRAITYYEKGSGADSQRNLELRSDDYGAPSVSLGIYPTDRAFEIRRRLAETLGIGDLDEARDPPPD